MSDDADAEEHREHMSRVFALLTAKLEDAVTLAAECQGRRTKDELKLGATQIAELSGEVNAVAAALSVLLGPREGGVSA